MTNRINQSIQAMENPIIGAARNPDHHTPRGGRAAAVNRITCLTPNTCRVGILAPIVISMLLALGSLQIHAADPVPPPQGPRTPSLPRIGMRTNLVPPALRPPPRTNTPAAVVPPSATPLKPLPVPPAAAGTKTNAAAKPAATATGTNAVSSLFDKVSSLPSNPLFYPVVIGLVVCLIVVLVVRSLRSRSKSPAAAATAAAAPSKAASRPPRRINAGSIHTCNVLEVRGDARQLWQFDTRGGAFVLGREQTTLAGDPLPASLTGRGWRGLFQRKLNVALLPPEKVFLRVIQLPRSDFDDTLAMVELQLEKLSPIPVTQVVWNLHVMSHAVGNMQTVVVIIVSRDSVEQFLGKLEGEGFLPDRLELSSLDQLQAIPITEDGAWIFPQAAGGKNTALVAWWYGGILQNLDLLSLPAANRPAGLNEQLLQMAWAGELEGWLTSPPTWHLVADVALAEWEAPLRAGLDQPIEVITPPVSSKLAGSTARRAAHADPRANLLPAEFAARYRQMFVDRLWMRGLLAVGALYAIGVLIYFAALAVATYQTDKVEAEVAGISNNYTNTVQLKARFQILKERQELKYAALDCWNTTARLLPEGVTLDSLNFSSGKRLTLSGTAPADQIQQLLNFERDMRNASVGTQPLFDFNKGESLQFRSQGATASWSLGLELKRGEEK